MSDDLTNRLGALATLSPPAPFHPAGTVRRRGRQRARRHAAGAGLASVALLVAVGTAVGTPLLRSDASAGPGQPPPPSGYGWSGPPQPPAQLRGPILLAVADLGTDYRLGTEFTAVTFGPIGLGCDSADRYPAESHRIAERQLTFTGDPNRERDDVQQTIVLYETGWAHQSMADLDAAVPQCSADATALEYHTIATNLAGDESRLIRATSEGGASTLQYIVVVRVGDRVTVIDAPAGRGETFARQLGTRAAARLR